MEFDDNYNGTDKDSKKIYSQDDYQESSLMLSKALNRIGFSEVNRMAMSGTSCIRETFAQIKSSLDDRLHCILKVGSLAEGTTQPFMGADEDMLMIITAMYIYKNKHKMSYCQMDTHLIILNDHKTPPGYTKLHMVKNRKIVSIGGNSEHVRQHDHIYESLTKDLKGRFVLSNILLKMTDATIDERNGPAETLLGKKSALMATDFVRAYYCDFVPDIARPWFHRIYSNWPSINIRDMLNHLGCFVVPVGCPFSAERELEWRFSFSLQEKYMMLNLNQTQYKCYIILKLIKTFILEHRVGKCISSYHCKTVLFHTIETSDISLWNEHNLIHCVLMCLKMMKTFVCVGFCPNYFIPEENMFIGKITLNSQHLLNDELLKLINNSDGIPEMIEQVFKFLALYSSSNILQLASNIHTEYERVSRRSAYDPVLSSIFGYHKIPLNLYNVYGFNFYDVCCNNDISFVGKHIVLNHLLNAVQYIADAIRFIESDKPRRDYLALPLSLRFIFFLKQCPPDIDGSHWSKLALLSKPFLNTDYEKPLIIEAFTLASSQIYTEIASLFSSMPLYMINDLQSKIMVLYDKGKGVNYFSNRLKLTTFYYKQKKYVKCIHELNDLFTEQYVTCFKCVCNYKQLYWRSYNRVTPPNGSIKTVLSIATDRMCCCVQFDIFELDAAISPLFYEGFRSFATPVGSRIDIDDYWLDRIVVDPVIYLNLMQKKCVFKLGYRPDDAKALSDIKQTIVNHLPHRDLAHLETALNILGHCYLRKGWSRLALHCYKVSWTIRPLHNAAKWHVAFLMFGNTYK